MNLGFSIKALGCILAPILIPFLIPLALAYFSLKALAFVVREMALTQGNERDRPARAFRVENRKRNTSPFANFRLRRTEPTDRRLRRHAQGIMSEINEALDHNQRITSDKRSSLKGQTRQMTDHALASCEKLAQIRRRKALVSVKRGEELVQLEIRLTAEIGRALDMLEDALVSIITVDVLGGNARIDRLVSDLNESNSRLRDIADAHDEIRTVREAWAGELE